MVTSSNNCLPFLLGSRVFLPKTARASSHAIFFFFSSRLVASSGLLVNSAVQQHSCQKTRHSSRAQARLQSSQPSAGETFFSREDRRIANGSGAGSAVTSSGPEGSPKDPPATELSPDIVAPVQRSVGQAAT